MARTKDLQRERLEADTRAFLEAGGTVEAVPYGHSGEVKPKLEERKGVPRYEHGQTPTRWRRYKNGDK